MPCKTLLSEARKVPNSDGTLVQEWLLLLNFHPLANDIRDVKSIVEALVTSKHELLQFDGILWYPRPHSKGVTLPFSESWLPE